jgi:hypothetical protein
MLPLTVVNEFINYTSGGGFCQLEKWLKMGENGQVSVSK